MNTCLKCLFGGCADIGEKGEDRMFCVVNRGWKNGNYHCKHFCENADISKEIKARYAFEIRSLENKGTIGVIIRQNWKAMFFTLLVSFCLFVLAAKFFDKYIF
jgi:hypothetical protein